MLLFIPAREVSAAGLPFAAVADTIHAVAAALFVGLAPLQPFCLPRSTCSWGASFSTLLARFRGRVGRTNLTTRWRPYSGGRASRINRLGQDAVSTHLRMEPIAPAKRIGRAKPLLASPARPPTKNGLFHRSKQHRLSTPTLRSPLRDALQGSLYTLHASGRPCSPSKRSHHRVQGRRLPWQHDRNDHLQVRSWYVLVWCRLERSFLRLERQKKKPPL